MERKFDYIIVGGGPSGLTASTMLTKLNKNILLVEREDSLGGCHRVKRIDGKFTQHSPMVYAGASLNFIEILNSIDYPFYDNFKEYNFSIFNVLNNQLLNTLNFNEFLILAKDFVLFLFSEKYLNDTSISLYTKRYNFSKESVDLLDKITRLSDGGDIDRYSVNSLFQLLNQNIFYKLYQPTTPNDLGLFKRWSEYLEERGTTLLFNSNVTLVNKTEKFIQIKEQKYFYTNLILSIPTSNIQELIPLSIPRDITYNTYVSVTFHFDTYLELPKIQGIPEGEWGIYWVVVTDYFDYVYQKGTIISATASLLESASNYTNKTLNQTEDTEEVKNEIFRQLNLNFDGSLPSYSTSLLNPNNYYENSWKCKDSAFLDIPKPIYLKNFISDNTYYIGSFNGNTYYKPTSVEKAITNTMFKLLEIEPQLSSFYKIKKGTYLKFIIQMVIICIVVLIFILK